MSRENDRTYNLAMVLEAIWNDLAKAEASVAEGKHEQLMVVEAAEVEVAFTVTNESSKAGGASIKVLSFDGSKSTATQEAHRITLRLVLEARQTVLDSRGQPAAATRRVLKPAAAKKPAPRGKKSTRKLPARRTK